MKVRNSVVTIKNAYSKMNGKKYELLMLLLILSSHIFFLKTTYKPYIFPDSSSYMHPQWKMFFGILPKFWTFGRTPVYPVFIAVVRFLFGEEKYLLAVVGIQEAFCFVSLFFLFRTLKMITSNRRVISLITLAYGCSPAVLSWNYCILTESLALSMCVIYVFLMCKFIKTKSDTVGMTVFICVLIMTFERPSFLLFLPVTVAFLLFFSLIGKHKKLLKTYLTALCSVVVVTGYSFGFYKVNGIFSISNPVPRQLLYVVMQRGYYKNSPNLEFRNIVEKSWDGTIESIWPSVGKVLGYYGLAESQKLAFESIKNSKYQYIRDEIRLSFDVCASPWNGYYINKDFPHSLAGNIKRALRILYINFFTILLHVIPAHTLLVAGFSLFVAIKQLFLRRINWLLFGCGCYVFLIFSSSMILTNAEYMRTMIHLLPLFYLNIVCLFDSLCNKGNKFYVQEF